MKLFFIIFPCIFLFLQSCTQSEVSRNAASHSDRAYQDSVSYIDRVGKTSADESMQTSSQAGRGAVIGGATGAVAGGLTSGVGIIPGAAGGMVLGGALGAYLEAHSTLVDRLQNRGVNIILLGDQILMVLPSHYLFQDQAAVLRPTAYSTLDLVGEFINGFTTMSVTVTAYINPTNYFMRQGKALSKLQAENVVKYLWRSGVNTRLLVAEGAGGTRPVASRSLAWDEGANYRVEITMEKLPV